MLCKQCGSENPADSRFCQSCGTKLIPGGLPEGEPESGGTPADPAQASSAGVTDVEEGKKPPLYGVGGWLLFFCISLTIFKPLANLLDAVAYSSSVFEVGVDFFFALFSVYAGVALWRKQPNALRVLKSFFLAVAVWYVLFALVFATPYFLDAGAVTKENDKDLALIARSLIALVIWLTYFKRSKRVRATYGRNL